MQRRDRRSDGPALPVVPAKGGGGAAKAESSAGATAAAGRIDKPAEVHRLVRSTEQPIPYKLGYREGVSEAEASAPRPRADRLPQTFPIYTAECEGLKLVSPNRIRGLTRGAALAQAAKVKRVRELGLLVTRGNVPPLAITGPMVFKAMVHVTITRIAPRFFDDDNFVSSCKPLRDGISDAFSLKDNDPRISFSYGQVHGKPRQYAVRVSYLITSV